MFKDFFKNKAKLNYLTYGLTFLLTVVVLIIIVQTTQINDFVTSMENSTFDLRQSIAAKSKTDKVSKDIVIINIDEASYEYLTNHYGEWPVPRNIYAELIHYLEKQNPKAIAFDLMFAQSLKSSPKADVALANAMNSYDNIFTSINFDNQPEDVRKPLDLPKKLKADIKDFSNTDFSQSSTFLNCRTILPSIMNGKAHVGGINVARSKDGMIRTLPSFMIYKNEYYPHLAFLVGKYYLEKTQNKKFDKLVLDRNSDLHFGERKIPVDQDGGIILNWYGPFDSTFKQIPFYKIIKDIKGEEKLNYNFKNKIIYIGTTALSLYDIKSVPVDKIYPGVGVHATFVNNMIDNNFIKKAPTVINAAICVLLGILVGYIVITSSSTIIALGSTILTTFGYIIVNYYVMKFFNIWIDIIWPLFIIFLVLATSYIIKYLMKSRDFEHQYKLATTDGLTELYNHRYFQEQMLMQIENCKRYNSHFSLILIDIDFFKKFNDTYGHQAGDAVLKQVAQTLKKNVRATDIVCRYGGEEMSIILPNTDKEEAIFTAQKVCQTIAAKPFRLGQDLEKNVTISLGVATYPQDGTKPNEMIEHSDQGLYKAKENGRNQVGL